MSRLTLTGRGMSLLSEQYTTPRVEIVLHRVPFTSRKIQSVSFGMGRTSARNFPVRSCLQTGDISPPPSETKDSRRPLGKEGRLRFACRLRSVQTTQISTDPDSQASNASHRATHRYDSIRACSGAADTSRSVAHFKTLVFPRWSCPTRYY